MGPWECGLCDSDIWLYTLTVTSKLYGVGLVPDWLRALVSPLKKQG